MRLYGETPVIGGETIAFDYSESTEIDDTAEGGGSDTEA